MPDGNSKGAPGGDRQEPFRNFNFRLEGPGQALFTDCSNFAMRVEVIPFREAGGQPSVRRLPGRVEYANVTLRSGMTQSRELWDWFLKAATGQCERRNVSIILLDTNGSREVARYNLNNAWPMEWNGPALSTRGQDVAIESLTLVFESLERGQ
jgi:phage tail-like protein